MCRYSGVRPTSAIVTLTVVVLPPRATVELHRLADAGALELGREVGEAPHRLAVDADDDVADLARIWSMPRMPARSAGEPRQGPPTTRPSMPSRAAPILVAPR